MDKTCSRCMLSKPISDFNRNSGMADGYLGQCKSCVRLALRTYRVANRKKIRAQQRKWEALPESKQKSSVRLKQWRDDHPKRRHAQIVVGNAVRDGKLVPEPCFVCGETAEAHHPDYDAPLAVVWLCPPHHKQIHMLVQA